MNANRVKRTGGLNPLVATGFALVIFFWAIDILVNIYVFGQGGLRDQPFHLEPAYSPITVSRGMSCSKLPTSPSTSPNVKAVTA